MGGTMRIIKVKFLLPLLFIFLFTGCFIIDDILNTTFDGTTTNTTQNITTTNNSNVTTTQKASENELVVHFIDVGQADSIFIQLPNTKTMIIDAGNNDDGVPVVNYITSLGVTRIDYVIGTHPHEDHIGGLDVVINSFEIGKIYMPLIAEDMEPTTKTYRDVLQAIDNKGLTITRARFGVIIFNETVDGLTLKAEILAPNSDKYSDLNDYSAVVKLEYGAKAFLFTGDAETVSENEILSKGVNLKANVLKVGHHGSDSSTSIAFLNTVQPEIAVICVGEGNTYGHPKPEVISRLLDKGIQIYRTDHVGHIIIGSNGQTLTIQTQKESQISDEDIPVVINEILPNPSPNNKEWVELYNPSDKTIDLSGFIIDDILGSGASPYVIPTNTFIGAYGYLVFEFNSVFNNDKDDVYLISPRGTIIDKFTYNSTVRDESFCRIPSGGNWFDGTCTPTKNAPN